MPAAKAKAPPAKVTVVAAAKSRAEFVRLLLDLERKSEEVRALVRRRCPWYSAAEVDALHEEFVVARARAPPPESRSRCSTPSGLNSLWQRSGCTASTSCGRWRR